MSVAANLIGERMTVGDPMCGYCGRPMTGHGYWDSCKTPNALTTGMDNVLASKLGDVMYAARRTDEDQIGDSIDGGLILCRLLNEAGFDVVARQPR